MRLNAPACTLPPVSRKRRKSGPAPSGAPAAPKPPPPAPKPSPAGSPPDAGQAAPTSAGRDGAPRPDWWGLHLWQIQPIRDVLLIAAVVLFIQLGYSLRIVTIPILVAMLVAYLFEPLVQRLTTRKWVSRQGAALLIIFSAAVVVIAPLTLGIGFAAVQTTQLARSLSSNIGLVRQAVDRSESPEALAETMDLLPNDGWRSIAEYFVELDRAASQEQAAGEASAGGLDAPKADEREEEVQDPPEGAVFGPPKPVDEEALLEERNRALREQRLREAKSAEFELMRYIAAWVETHASEIGQQALATGRGAVGIALGTAGGLGVFLFQGFLTAFFFYFFSTGWGKVQEFWESLIPERRKGLVIDLLRKMDAVIAGFVRGRLLIGVILSIYFTVAYWLIGVPAPLLLGPITGALCLVPYLGIVSVPTAIIAMWLSPSPWLAFQTSWWWMVFAPIVVYNAGQFFDDYVLTPNIQGKSTNMDVPSILFATIAGGAIGGIYGLLLAIPLAACIKILLNEVFWPRFQRWATGKERDFLPIDRN